VNSAAVPLALAFLAFSAVAPVAAQSKPETSATPAERAEDSGSPASSLSPELVAQGEKVFQGSGNCYACHGSNGEGSVGPNLTDAEWLHSKGTIEEIAAQIISGVPKEKAKSGIPMPPKGGGTLSDEDVKAVAAYVYSLSRK
jgi:mono/diheme cytochrome c family protein